MKKKAAGFLLTVILLGVCAASASGGTAADPLISKSYAGGVFVPAAVEQGTQRTDRLGEEARIETQQAAAQRAGLILARTDALTGGAGYAATFREQRFKRGDTLSMETGSGAVLLAGAAEIRYPSGAVIDVTAGVETLSGGAMEAGHRYLAGEETLCSFTVTSDTAVLAPQGYYTVTKSDRADYNELADALKEMGLFKGSLSALGSGYELEEAPTRIQGLIMFLRLTGEETAALAHPGSDSFRDVPEWCRGYVGYAEEKGYVKGYGDGTFGTDDLITAQQFTTLMLRALGYRDDGETPDFTYDTAIPRAFGLGVVTAGERELLSTGEFLRAQVVYFSYYALSAPVKGGGEGASLLDRLISGHAIDASLAEQVMTQVSTKRLE